MFYAGVPRECVFGRILRLPLLKDLGLPTLLFAGICFELFCFSSVVGRMQDAHGRAPGEDFHETVATPLKVAVSAALR